ncbi:MAG: DNA-binding transcriptional MerR regulator [Nitriliruptoraceae bacterium]
MSGVTIGHVLNRLKEEFPDITITKIRFLDAERLIEPDRTPAGYRVFTDIDVERLRYILRAQRDRGISLARIRQELVRLDAGEDPMDVITGAAAVMDAVGGVRVDELGEPSVDDDGDAAVREDADEDLDEHGVHDALVPPAATSRPVGSSAVALSAARLVGGELHLSGRELAEAAGLELRDVRSLQEHALLPPGDVFDGDGLAAAKAAAGLLHAGLEARHLRMYRQFTDREVSLHQQLVAPMLRQRNPQARQRAAELLQQLTENGTELHAALLRRELRSMLRP